MLLGIMMLGGANSAWADAQTTGLTTNPMTAVDDHFTLAGDEESTYDLVATYDCTSSTAPNGGWTKKQDAGVTNLNGFTVKPIRYQANKTGNTTDLYALLTIKGAGYYYYFPEYGMDCENDFTVSITDFREGMVLVAAYKRGKSDNSAVYEQVDTQYDYSTTEDGLSLLGGKNTDSGTNTRTAYLSFSVYRKHVNEIDLQVSKNQTDMVKEGSCYFPQYNLSAINANTDENVAATYSVPSSEDYTLDDNVFTYKKVHNTDVTITASYGGKETSIDIPACTTGYVKTASYDLTNKSTYINSLISGDPTNPSITVNGFTDSADRYQFDNSSIMLSNGLYANTKQMLFFVGYGLTNAGKFSLQFLNHETGFVYAYKKKVCNSGTYASAQDAVDWVTSATATNLDMRGTSIYTSLDVYAPTNTNVTISLPNAYASYASALTLDFSDVDARYIKDDNGTLKALKVSKAAANTPLLITKQNEETSITIPVVDMSETTTDTDGNLLVAQLSTNGNLTLSSSSAPVGHAYYALGAVDGIPGFYKIGANDVTIAYGKAYLDLASGAESSSRANIIFDNDMLTGITHQYERNISNKYYNLQGILVNNPSHGVFILNGKKIILK